MGKHLADSRYNEKQIADGNGVKPEAIKYTFAKRLSIATEVKAGVPVREVARRFNVSTSTVYNCCHHPDILELIDPQIVDERRKSIAALYELRSDQALSAIDQEKLEKSSAAALMIISATATDKANLVRSQALQRTSRGVVDDAVDALEKLKNKREFLEKTLGNMQNNAHLLVEAAVVDAMSTDLTQEGESDESPPEEFSQNA